MIKKDLKNLLLKKHLINAKQTNKKNQLNNTADKSNKLLHALILILNQSKFFKHSKFTKLVFRDIDKSVKIKKLELRESQKNFINKQRKNNSANKTTGMKQFIS